MAVAVVAGPVLEQAAVRLDDPAGDREAQARAVGGAAPAREGNEDVGDAFRRNAGAVVAHVATPGRPRRTNSRCRSMPSSPRPASGTTSSARPRFRPSTRA